MTTTRDGTKLPLRTQGRRSLAPSTAQRSPLPALGPCVPTAAAGPLPSSVGLTRWRSKTETMGVLRDSPDVPGHGLVLRGRGRMHFSQVTHVQQYVWSNEKGRRYILVSK